MQLFAFGEQGNVHISDAEKGKNYNCLGCNGIIRAKKGRIKQPHFYHIKKTSFCREANKSLLHLQMQEHLLSILPKNEAVMEKPFPKIKRIADVFWQNQKIIFEIQCSPISEEEVQARNQDYRSMGFKVVWLLSDRLFNKKKCKKSELVLRKEGAYFFSVKKGITIYDQSEKFRGLFRVYFGPMLISLLDRPKEILLKKGYPDQLLHRKICFEGDLLDRLSAGKRDFYDGPPTKKNLRKRFVEILVKPFLGFWEFLLQVSL